MTHRGGVKTQAAKKSQIRAKQSGGKKRTIVAKEGALKQAVDISHNRLLLVSCVFFLFFGAIAVRLVDLSISHADAGNRHVSAVGDSSIEAVRGNILDRNGMIIATSLRLASIYADGREILDASHAAQQLGGLFPELDVAKLTTSLSSKRAYIPVKKHLHPEQLFLVNRLGIPGVKYEYDEKRVYPHKGLFSHILGMVGDEGKGLSGIEQAFDAQLSTSREQGEPPVALSLDLRVQSIMHEKLQEAMEKFSAVGAAGVVMDIESGELLASVSLPDFDPNVLSEVKIEHTFNNVTKGLFEMGSTFKAFTIAAALDSGVINVSDIFETQDPVRMGRFRIRDHHPLKWDLSTPEILVHSSNIGTAKIADILTAERQRSYLQRLHLLDELTLEIPETARPQYPSNWGRLSTMTIGYGHGISVTPLHVAAAMGAVVNDGQWVPPTLIVNQKREELPPVRQVFSKETSHIMRDMLRMVVAEGTGKSADAIGYFVGGKTGTAEKPGKKGRYDRKRMVSSFAGVFPSHDPKYVVLVSVDEPKGIKETWGYATAGWTAAPVVKQVVEVIGPMLGVVPVNSLQQESRESYATMKQLIRKEEDVAAR